MKTKESARYLKIVGWSDEDQCSLRLSSGTLMSFMRLDSVFLRPVNAIKGCNCSNNKKPVKHRPFAEVKYVLVEPLKNQTPFIHHLLLL